MENNKINLVILIIFPFIFLGPYTFQLIDVGNDFELYYFTYKKYIFELLRNGHIPLWSPGEASGYSLIFNPLTQFFYLPSWIHFLISFFIGSLSKYSFLLYTISAISIFNIGLFNFLKTFNINKQIILITVLIISMSLKITELLRFPNALHTFCWFPWILYGINLIQKKNNTILGIAIIFISCLMICTAGYPYYIFYGIIFFSAYLLFLTIIKNKNNIYGTNQFQFETNFFLILKVSIPVVSAGLLFAPIYLKITELMSITRDRSVSDFNFSIQGSSNIYDQAGSWIFPPFAIAEGWYYFGAASTFIVLIFFLFSFFIKESLLKYSKTLRIIIIFFLLYFFLNYQFANTENSILFKYIWLAVEPINNFRFWIRINITLIPIIALLLALSLQNLIKIIDHSLNLPLKKVNLFLVTLIILILLTQIYFINYSHYNNNYWDTWQAKRINVLISSLPNFISSIVGLYFNYIYSIFFSIIFLFMIFILNYKSISLKFKKNNFLLHIVLILTFSEMFLISNIQWAIPHNYYENGFEKLNLKKNYNSFNDNALNDILIAFKEKRVSLEKSGTKVFQGNTYYRHNKRFNINYINHWGNSEHTMIFDKYFERNGSIKKNLNDDLAESIKYFYGMDENKKKIFYSDKLIHNNIFDFVNENKVSEKTYHFTYDLLKYNGDELIIEIKVSKPGWVSFIDTWDPNWQVYVNGKKNKIEKLFNAYKSVYVKDGITEVKFVYKPFSFILVNLPLLHQQ